MYPRVPPPPPSSRCGSPHKQGLPGCKAVGNALILNGNGLAPCPHGCGSLRHMLRRTNFFDRVHERSFEAPDKDVHNTPDLILPRFLLKDWAKESIKRW